MTESTTIEHSDYLDGAIDNDEAAGFVNVSPKTLETWRCRGKGPSFIKYGRAVRYTRRKLISWMETRQRANTSAVA